MISTVWVCGLCPVNHFWGWLGNAANSACYSCTPLHHFPATFRPPANDAADKHQGPSVPDQGRQWIDEDANGRLSITIPVSQKDVDIGQAKSSDGDQDGRLVVKVVIFKIGECDDE